MTNNNGPLIELARKHAAQPTPMRFGCYSVPGGLVPSVAWAVASDEGMHFAVFLTPNPDRLMNQLLCITPHEVLSLCDTFAEVCDAYVLGFIETDGTIHTERTEATPRGQTALHLASRVLEKRKTRFEASESAVH